MTVWQLRGFFGRGSAVLAGAVLLIATSGEARASYEFPISARASWEESFPRVSGDRVVWAGRPKDGSAQFDIFIFHMSTGQLENFTNTPSTADRMPDIDGDWLIWVAGAQLNIRNLTTGESHQINAVVFSPATRPRVDYPWVVYMDELDDEILAYDLESRGVIPIAPTHLAADDWNKFSFGFHGSTVAWVGDDPSNSRSALYISDLITGETIRVVGQTEGFDPWVPAVGERLVVWEEQPQGRGWAIYAYDFVNGGSVFPIRDTGESVQDPSISGNLVVWSEHFPGPTAADIMMHDLTTGKDFFITSVAGVQVTPDIRGNRIVWEDARADSLGDIFMFEIDPDGVAVYNPYPDEWNSKFKGQLHAHPGRYPSCGPEEECAGAPSEVLIEELESYRDDARFGQYHFLALGQTWPIFPLVREVVVDDIHHITSVEAITETIGIAGCLGDTNLSCISDLTCHVVGIGVDVNMMPSEFPLRASVGERARVISSAGGLPILAHPYISIGPLPLRCEPFAQFLAAKFLWGIEISNAAAQQSTLSLDIGAIALWDEALRSGRRLFGVAVDDRFPVVEGREFIHSRIDSFDRGWVEIISQEDTLSIPSNEFIIDALKRGSFISKRRPLGEGPWSEVNPPDISRIRLDSTSMTLEIECSTPGFVRVIGATGRIREGLLFEESAGVWRTRWQVGMGERAVRVELYPEEAFYSRLNLMVFPAAYTQPIYLDSLAGNAGTGSVAFASRDGFDFSVASSENDVRIGPAYVALISGAQTTQEVEVSGRMVPTEDLPAVAPPGGYIGNVYELTSTGSFSATLEIHFDPSELRIFRPLVMQVFRYMTNLEEWESLPTNTDQESSIASASISGPGVYALSAIPPDDSESPFIDITSPLDGGSFAGLMMFRAFASDDNGVSLVSFFANGMEVGYATLPDSENAWTTTVNLNLLPSGPVVLLAVAEDAAGNLEEDSIVITNQGGISAPVVEIQSPTSGEAVPVKKFCVSGSWGAAEDVGAVELTLDDIPIGPATLDGSAWSYCAALDDALAGNRVIRAILFDQYGNRATDEVSVTVQPNAKPTAPDASSPSGVCVNLEASPFTFTATDPDGDELRYCVDWGDETPLECSDFVSSGTSVEFAHTHLSEGQFDITVWAEDQWGAVSDTSAVRVTVVDCPPEATIRIPSPDETVKWHAGVCAAVLQRSFPVSRVDFFADGHPVGFDDDGPDAAGHWCISWLTLPICHDPDVVLTAQAIDNQGVPGPLSPPVEVTVNNRTFPDVDCDYWAWLEIEVAACDEIVAGFPDGSYKPERTLRRDEMAVFLSRAANFCVADFESFQPPDCGSETFPDVDCEHPLYKFIEYIASKGIASGFEDGTYRPAANVTRIAMAVFLAGTRDLCDGDFLAFEPPACGDETFDDVPCDHPQYKFVEYIVGKGITAGISTDPPLYGPLKLVTRAQMAVFIVATVKQLLDCWPGD